MGAARTRTEIIGDSKAGKKEIPRQEQRHFLEYQGLWQNNGQEKLTKLNFNKKEEAWQDYQKQGKGTAVRLQNRGRLSMTAS